MDTKILDDTLHGILCFKKVKQIYTHKDLYKSVTRDIDLTKLKIDVTLRHKEVLEWVLQHPEYDYKELLESLYSNEELFRFFKVSYEDTLFKLNKYFSGDYIIKLSEIENM